MPANTSPLALSATAFDWGTPGWLPCGIIPSVFHDLRISPDLSAYSLCIFRSPAKLRNAIVVDSADMSGEG